MDFIKSFSDDQYTSGFDAWKWLDLSDKKPLFASCFGDIFFESSSGYWFLDTMQGTLTKEWHDREHLDTALSTPKGQSRYLLDGLAMSAEKQGLILQPGEVYTFVQPPITGGNFGAKNITTAELAQALILSGELHAKLKGISGSHQVTLDTIDSEQEQPSRVSGENLS